MRWPFMNWLRGAPGSDGPAPGAPATPGVSESAPGAPGASEAAPGASAAPDPMAGARAEPRPAAWLELSPVQRTVGAVPLTAQSTAFARELASRREPDPMLEPLGHDMTHDGPAGLVSGIAVPIVQRTSLDSAPRATSPLPSPSAPPRGRPTLQRGVTTIAALPPRGAAERAAAAASDVPALEDARAALAPAEAPAAGDAPGLVLRALPVARLATGAPAIAATRVADATAPVPVQALARVVTSGAPSPRPAASTTPPPAPNTPGDTTPPAPVGDTPPDVTDVPTFEPIRSHGPDHPVVARRTLGESRRLGLGAPLVGPAPSAAWEGGRSELPVARRARSSDAESPAKSSAPASPAMPPAAAASEPLPRLVVARRASAPATTIATMPASRPGGDASAAAGTPDWSAGPGSGAAPDGAPVRAPATDADAPDAIGPADAIAPVDAPAPMRPLVGESPIGVARLARDDPGAGDAPDAAGEPSVGELRPSSASATRSDVDERAGRSGSGVTSAPSIGGTAGAGGGLAGTVGSEGSGGPTVQRTTGAAPVPHGSPASARSLATTTGVPAVAPLVASRPMRPGATPSMTTSTIGLAGRADGEPTAVVAQLRRTPFAAASPAAAPGPHPASAGDPGAPSGPGDAVRWDERPVVARAAAGSGRAATVSAPSTLPLLRAAGTASGERPAGGTAGAADAVSWTPAGGFTTIARTPGPFVQRAVEIDEVSATTDVGAAAAAESGAGGSGAAGPGAGESGAAAAGQAATAGAPAAGPGGAGTDYEEIAEHVYDRIRARLTTELLLDRERAGTLVDG